MQNGETCFATPPEAGDVERVRSLLDAGAARRRGGRVRQDEPHARVGAAVTSMSFVCCSRPARTSRLPTKTAGRVSSCASKEGHVVVVRVLLDSGAPVDHVITMALGRVFMWASFYGHADVVRLLLDAGANVSLADARTARTSLIVASREGEVDVVRLLLDAGAQVDQADRRVGMLESLLGVAV